MSAAPGFGPPLPPWRITDGLVPMKEGGYKTNADFNALAEQYDALLDRELRIQMQNMELAKWNCTQTIEKAKVYQKLGIILELEEETIEESCTTALLEIEKMTDAAKLRLANYKDLSLEQFVRATKYRDQLATLDRYNRALKANEAFTKATDKLALEADALAREQLMIKNTKARMQGFWNTSTNSGANPMSWEAQQEYDKMANLVKSMEETETQTTARVAEATKARIEAHAVLERETASLAPFEGITARQAQEKALLDIRERAWQMNQKIATLEDSVQSNLAEIKEIDDFVAKHTTPGQPISEGVAEEMERSQQLTREMNAMKRQITNSQAAAEALAKSEATAAQALEKMAPISGTGMEQLSTLKQALAEREMIGIEIARAMQKMEQPASRLRAGYEILTNGYIRYMERITTEANFSVKAKYWKEAQNFIEMEHKKYEASVMEQVSELQVIFETQGEEAFLAAAARMNAPSTRMFLMIAQSKAELAASWEAAGAFERIVLAPQWVSFAVESTSRAARGVAFRGLEKIVSAEVLVGMELILDGLISLGETVLSKVFGLEGLALYVLYKVVQIIRKDGFTEHALDDILRLVGLNLNMFRTTAEILSHYPKFSTPAKDQSESAKISDSPVARLHQIDHESLRRTIDFWGEYFVHTLTPASETAESGKYEPMQPMIMMNIIPGRYVDPNNRQLDSNFAYATSTRLEAFLDSSMASMDAMYTFGPKIDILIPKIKGLVRNFATFPMTKTQQVWPNVYTGEPRVLRGGMQARMMDKRIVHAFEYWLDSGEYGPIYQQSTNPQTQQAAAQACKDDLAQWLKMDPTYPGAMNQVLEWLNTNHGKAALTQPDLLILSPEEFMKEYEAEEGPYLPGTFFYGGGTPGQHDDYRVYEYNNKAAGRFCVAKNFRKFYKMVATWGMMPMWYEKAWGTTRAFFTKGWKTASDDTMRKYQLVHDKIEKIHSEILERARLTEKEWENITLRRIWDVYKLSEMPFRTRWTYIQKHKAFFIENMHYYVMLKNNAERDRIWAEWLKYKHKYEPPLDLDAAHRVYWMGQFAKLAYGDEYHANSLETAVKDQFDGIASNILVTTKKALPGSLPEWAEYIQRIQNVPDFPIEFGELHCRIIVLKKPKTLILCFKGSTDVMDFVIDADFTAAALLNVSSDYDTQYTLNPPCTFASDFDTKAAKTDTIMFSSACCLIHRGFTRATHALLPKITAEMNTLIQESEQSGDPILNVMCCGHSLGAAMAQIAALVIPRIKNPLHTKARQLGQRLGDLVADVAPYRLPNVYCYSSPLIGDARFADLYSRFVHESVHLYTDGDAVCALPPFLLIPEDLNKGAHDAGMQAMLSIAADNPPAMALLVLVSKVYPKLLLPGLGDISSKLSWLFGKMDTDFARRMLLAAESVSALMAKRGRGVFLRVSDDPKVRIVESNDDRGNTNSVLYNLIHLGENHDKFTEFFKEMHSITGTLARFERTLKQDTNIFDKIDEKLPAWVDNGVIVGGSGLPTGLRTGLGLRGGRDLLSKPINPTYTAPVDTTDPWIRKVLHDPNAKILGYVTTKKRNKGLVQLREKDVYMHTLDPDVFSHEANYADLRTVLCRKRARYDSHTKEQ